MEVITIGKTKIDIQTRGCWKCGSLHSHHWRVVKTIKISVDAGGTRGSITREIGIHVCGDCDDVPTF
jgi:hypothetical protein